MILGEHSPWRTVEDFASSEVRSQVLFEASHALLSPSGIEAALQAVAGILETHLPLEGVLVALVEEGAPRILAMAENDREAVERHFTAVARPVFDHVKVTGKAVPDPLGPTLEMCELCNPAQGEPLCSLLGVPVHRGQETVGVLVAQDREERRDEDGTRTLLELLALVARLVGQAYHFQEMVARDRKRLMEEGNRAQKELGAVVPEPRSQGKLGILGESPQIQEVLRKIRIAARNNLPVLLRGESGTGKELFAQAVHALSGRSQGPMVRLNCAALSETMLESELFGHEKGAFTGALSQRKGRFELADGGTIFLDEIGEISAGFQSKLLRVLQEGEFERVGGSETIKVDARVVAATNRDLEEDVRKGIFRSDLYFRLCVIPIQLPPLRERAQDIPLLANSFLRRYNENNGTQLVFDRDALEVIQGCAFPGNIRELQSCVSRTAAFCTGNSIQAKDFACSNGSCLSKLLCSPGSLRQEPVSVTSVPSTSSLTDLDSRSDSDSRHEEGSVFEVSSGVDASSSFPDEDSMPHGSSERMRLLEAMERSGWVQAKAARLLGLTARQVCYALRKHGIEVKKF